MGARRIGALGIALAALALAGCDYGEATTTTYVDDTSAQLDGLLHNDSTGSLSYWFEYGPSPEYGSRTSTRSLNFTSAGTKSVSVRVYGLEEGTTYHFRVCARNPRSGGVCGAPQTFTTTAGRDSVQGLGVSFEIPEIGHHVGTAIDASALADGTDLEGRASTSPGSAYFRLPDEGDVTCLRVEGRRASIGFVADLSVYEPSLGLVNVLVHVEDVGPVQDLFIVTHPDEAPTTCPDPDVAFEETLLPQLVTRGDLVVHDHP